MIPLTESYLAFRLLLVKSGQTVQIYNLYAISYQLLKAGSYLQVLKEILRLYPPVSGTLRWTEKKNVIEGIEIPANTTLFVSLCSLLPYIPLTW